MTYFNVYHQLYHVCLLVPEQCFTFLLKMILGVVLVLVNNNFFRLSQAISKLFIESLLSVKRVFF